MSSIQLLRIYQRVRQGHKQTTHRTRRLSILNEH